MRLVALLLILVSLPYTKHQKHLKTPKNTLQNSPYALTLLLHQSQKRWAPPRNDQSFGSWRSPNFTISVAQTGPPASVITVPFSPYSSARLVPRSCCQLVFVLLNFPV